MKKKILYFCILNIFYSTYSLGKMIDITTFNPVEFNKTIKNKKIDIDDDIGGMYLSYRKLSDPSPILKLSNITINAEKEKNKEAYFGIYEDWGNVNGDNIKILSNIDQFIGIWQDANLGRNDQVDDPTMNQYIGHLTYKNTDIKLTGDNAIGVYINNKSNASKPIRSTEFDNVNIELSGNSSTGIRVMNEDVKANNLQIKNNSKKGGIGIIISNNGLINFDKSSIKNIQENNSNYIAIKLEREYLGKDRNVQDQHYWDINKYKDDQSILIKNSDIDAGKGIGLYSNGGTSNVNLRKTKINATTLLKAEYKIPEFKKDDKENNKENWVQNTNFNITASDQSELSGKISTLENSISTLNLDRKSKWTANGNSNVTNLGVNGGSTVFFKKDQDGKYTHTIAENLYNAKDVIGKGILSFGVDFLDKKGSTFDINQSTNGYYLLSVNNNGAQKAKGDETVWIFKDPKSKGGNTWNGKFEGDKNIEIGGYKYVVRHIYGKDINDWYLAPYGDKPTPNDNSRTISGLNSTSYLMNLEEQTTLRQRLGDIKSIQNGIKTGAWGRIYGGNYKTKDNRDVAKADMNYSGVQVGGDRITSQNNTGSNFTGIFGGYTQGNPKYDRGNATAKSLYLGLYDTYQWNNGFYVDGVFKLGKYNNHYHLHDSQDKNFDGSAHSTLGLASVEAGKNITLKETDTYKLYVEPQAQLSVARIGKFNTTASNGLNVYQGSYTSVIGRAGLLFGTRVNNKADVYLKSAYLHEFKGNVSYKLNDSPESYSLRGNGVEIGLGGNFNISKQSYIYAEGNYLKNKDHYHGSKFNIGYRHQF